MTESTEDQTPRLLTPEGNAYTLSSPYEIGRSETCSLSLNDTQVSRNHCILQQDGKELWWITDLESTNGTYVNGRRITQATQLQNQDTLTLGNQHLVFRGCTTIHPKEVTAEGPEKGTTINFSQIDCWLLVGDIVRSSDMSNTQSPSEINQAIGEWGTYNRKIIEKYGGEINKFLGDGYFAYWRAEAIQGETIPALLNELEAIREQIDMPFRLILHYGSVQIGGMMTRGEENLSGSAVNFVFKSEKVAANSDTDIFISDTAATRIKGASLASAGLHPVPGFPGEHAFFTLKR